MERRVLCSQCIRFFCRKRRVSNGTNRKSMPCTLKDWYKSTFDRNNKAQRAGHGRADFIEPRGLRKLDYEFGSKWSSVTSTTRKTDFSFVYFPTNFRKHIFAHRHRYSYACVCCLHTRIRNNYQFVMRQRKSLIRYPPCVDNPTGCYGKIGARQCAAQLFVYNTYRWLISQEAYGC